MKRVFLSALLICVVWGGVAQGIQDFRMKLFVPDTLYGSRVRVIEHGRAADVLSRLALRERASAVAGYRVRIFFDNGQNARAEAVEIMDEFRTAYPEVPVYMSYENPYFMVSAGNCMNVEEALILWGRIKDRFVKAYPMRQTVPLEEFYKKVSPPDSTALQ